MLFMATRFKIPFGFFFLKKKIKLNEQLKQYFYIICPMHELLNIPMRGKLL